MHDTGCSLLVHWDNPEGWDGEGGGRGVQDGEHKYTHGRFKSNIKFEIAKKILIIISSVTDQEKKIRDMNKMYNY